jgi:hypothetical protein
MDSAHCLCDKAFALGHKKYQCRFAANP